MNTVSFENLAIDLLTAMCPLKYLLTYKDSQDHIEIFLSCVQCCGGLNNNSNALQLSWSIRKKLFSNSVSCNNNAKCTAYASNGQ